MSKHYFEGPKHLKVPQGYLEAHFIKGYIQYYEDMSTYRSKG